MQDTVVAGSVVILGVVGSLRRESYNAKLLKAAGGLMPQGARLAIWDGLKGVPPFDEDDEGVPPASVVAMRQAFEGAGALLIATPQYNASLPGQLKNALDWASRPYETNVLRGKPVAVIGASLSPSGGARAQTEARTVLRAMGADVVDVGLSVGRAFRSFDDQGRLLDRELGARLAEILREVTARAGEGPGHRSASAPALARCMKGE